MPDLTHEGTKDEVAEYHALATQIAEALNGTTCPIALKVCETLSAHILLQTYPHLRREVMDNYFAAIRKRVFGDA